MASDQSLRIDIQLNGAAAPQLDVRFEVPAGISVLFGPSGAGKTTTLLAIAGLVKPQTGRIELGEAVLFDSEARIHLPAYQRRIALVFQSLALFPHLSAERNVEYGLPRSVPARERRGRAGHWLERMRVAQVAERKPATLSGGEAQRVALARALASEPRALLLDEPFSALDAPLRRELGRELRELSSGLSIPVLLVTHDRNDARDLGERVLILEAGRIRARGHPAQMLE